MPKSVPATAQQACGKSERALLQAGEVDRELGLTKRSWRPSDVAALWYGSC